MQFSHWSLIFNKPSFIIMITWMCGTHGFLLTDSELFQLQLVSRQFKVSYNECPYYINGHIARLCCNSKGQVLSRLFVIQHLDLLHYSCALLLPRLSTCGMFSTPESLYRELHVLGQKTLDYHFPHPNFLCTPLQVIIPHLCLFWRHLYNYNPVDLKRAARCCWPQPQTVCTLRLATCADQPHLQTGHTLRPNRTLRLTTPWDWPHPETDHILRLATPSDWPHPQTGHTLRLTMHTLRLQPSLDMRWCQMV